MRKIPTVFKRDPDDMSRILPEVNPDAAWVLAGEGEATRKYDGTCVAVDVDDEWWARREVKPGKTPPPNFRVVEDDPATGKTFGWEPMAQSAFAKWHAEALAAAEEVDWEIGTYELCGPKINSNPEGFDTHVLVPHEYADALRDAPRDFEGLRTYLTDGFPHEGIVWHHPDGRMAKLKVRDFR